MTARPIYLRRWHTPPGAWQVARRLGGVGVRLLPWALVLTVLLALAGCNDPTAPTQPPYIAVVAVITAAPGTDVGAQYSYRIEEISGTLKIDKTFHVSPTDTVIMPVKPATYRITLTGLPPQCQVQDGNEIYLLVPPGSNTAIWRYLISCESQLTVTTGTDGFAADNGFIYHVTGPGSDRTGILTGNDTLRMDGLAPGDYDVSLAHVASNCVVTNDGGTRLHFALDGKGGSKADFRIVCSDEAHRPSLLSFASSYHDGTSGFLIRATDPDHDIERYAWDITDCHGKSVLTGGGRLRRGLSQDRSAGQDTITVFGAIELGLPDASVQGHCTSIRVADEFGNTTPVVEELIGNETGPGPLPAYFNAQFSTTASLSTQLTMTDPAFAGVFAAALLRDGILFPPDGNPDLGVFNTEGYTDVLLPTVPLGGNQPQYYDYYSVILYLFDSTGNFTRVEDNDLFH
ncbi:MAG: hypothetical protein ABI742_01235 [Gemmatimonadota bacterium]